MLKLLELAAESGVEGKSYILNPIVNLLFIHITLVNQSIKTYVVMKQRKVRR